MPLWSALLDRAPRHRLALLGLVLIVAHFWYRKRRSMPFGQPHGKARRMRAKGEEYDFDEYDVVVVGGGTAGVVVAARLSEDPSIRVCLLEAGQSSLKNPFATIPLSYSRLMHTRHEWKMFTVPQPDTDGGLRYWPRAKLLGGCNTFLTHTISFHTCAPEDYDEWARLQKGQEGADQWAYRNFDHYLKKFEGYQPNALYPDVDLTLRGTTGPVQTGLHSYTSPTTPRFIQSCEEIGIPLVPDLNTSAGSMGVSKVSFTLTYITPRGRRSTSEFAYFTPEVLARPNLTVITEAHVTRVLFETTGSVPRAVGAEFSRWKGDIFQVRAKKEVILCAGAVHTPQIMMLSGVGPADHLTFHDIPVVADLPGVGSNLIDHPVVDFNFLDKTGSSIIGMFGDKPQHKLKLVKELFKYSLLRKGMLTGQMAEAIAFVRATDPSLFPPDKFPPSEIEDVSSGPGAPDIELFCTPAGYLKHGMVKMESLHYFALHAILLRPTSTGTIRLRSNNPRDAPLIDPRYLSTENDMAMLVRAVDLLKRIFRTAPFAAMADPAGAAHPDLDHGFAELSGAALEDTIRRKCETIYHPTSSARMAPLADGGVLDPYLRVHGIPNLRVADASAFPAIVSGHTAAPAFAIGEKVADLVKAAIASKV
ncbi:GMC oxidoreductase [Epithele typhae]|uniref:GMC oxidoreductase n=1 Tax=Epithele typhae TaxID=378194 RepID=UPI002007D770|nr:GMC oxidoreductase [Epithele typhae]KAH9945051.1 GMC oxidoreductase [Epithele typhae]